MNQLLAHLIGDYFLQSDYCALNKTKRHFPCFLHCVLYTLPFLFLTQNFWALFLIFFTHFIEDRWSLIKYVIWFKNHINPKLSYYSFDKCSVTGYYDTWLNENYEARPKFITTWLYIISDNAYHLLCNFLILKYLG